MKYHVMKNQPLISVIVPVYCVESYIDYCIKSIIRQSYRNLEIILIDDGSPDGCPEICDVWAERDNRIRVIHKKNGGLSEARNVGIDIATGEYIAFVDSDDFIESEMYSKMMEAIMRTGAEIACCGRYLINEDKRIPLHCLSKEIVFDRKSALREILIGNLIEEAAWDKVYRKDLFVGIRYPVGEINEDIVVIPSLLEKCNKLVHIGVPMYNYRFTSDGITKSRYNEKKSIYLKHIIQINGYINEYYPELIKEMHIFSGRYAYALLIGMAIDGDIVEKYHYDYCQYKKILCDAFPHMLKLDSISIKDKIQILLLILGLYRILWVLRH